MAKPNYLHLKNILFFKKQDTIKLYEEKQIFTTQNIL
jgi:hypothetical protein